MAGTDSRSKTPSDPNSSSKPRDVTFFIDRALGKRKVADALRALARSVEVHDDHFPQNAKDEDWLRVVGQREWVVLTKDRQIRMRQLELRALVQAKVAAFVLTAGSLTGDEIAAVFAKSIAKIERFLTSHRRPFIARVTANGRLSLLYGMKTKKRLR